MKPKRLTLDRTHPDIAKEWHPTKNGSLTPKDITYGSEKAIWWICKNGHEYDAKPNHRTFRGSGCPYCSGRRVNKDNCLEAVNPNLAKEWHPTKNGNLTPRDVTVGSHKKVWWECYRGHEWETPVSNRSGGTGCPYCNSQVSALELRIFSELKYLFKGAKLKEKIHGYECDIFVPKLKLGVELDGVYWHRNKKKYDTEKTKEFFKKGILLIRLRERGLKKISELDIIYDSKTTEVGLICDLLKTLLKKINLSNYEKIKTQEYCRNRTIANNELYLQLLERLPKPLPGTSLKECNSRVAAEWHPTKNGNLRPEDVACNSNLKVWWICEKGHEYEALIYSRNKGNNCKFCAGQAATIDNNLLVKNPVLAAEWHPTKNDNLTPRDVTVGSHKKVWWICGNGHEYVATVHDRSKGNGCPYCSGKRVNKENCLEASNPLLAKEWHPTKNGNLTPRDVTAKSGKKVWWECDKGHEWRTSVDNRNRRRGTGCPYCAGRKK